LNDEGFFVSGPLEGKPMKRFPFRSLKGCLTLIVFIALVPAIGLILYNAVRALKAGAAGYLTKGSAEEELVKAVRKILSGGKYVSPSLAEKMAFDLEAKTEKPLHETLSDREYQVMLLIASGKAASKIADELSLSVKTIDTYRTRILEKMGMKTNAELTHYAIKNKLVE
jgi:DNA-binding NarL/FixJ family response regulator